MSRIDEMNSYAKLMEKFGQAHGRHVKSPFAIEMFSIEGYERERKHHPNDFLNNGKFLFTQKTGPKCENPVVVCATTFGSFPAFEGMTQEDCYESAKQAWAEFEPLATEAGVYLPPAITGTLPDETDDSLLLWFALLYQTHPLDKADLERARHDRKILLRSPFKASAETIELCRLTSDDPKNPSDPFHEEFDISVDEDSSTDDDRTELKATGMSIKEANNKAFELAEEDPKFLDGTQRAWASKIGCSAGQIGKLPLWQKTMEKTGRGRKDKPLRPKTVSFTEKVEATQSEGKKHEVLDQFIREQEIDSEPSPFDPDGRSPIVYHD